MIFWQRLFGLAVVTLVPLSLACGEEDPTGVEGDPALATLTAVVHDSAAVLPAGRTTMSPPDSTAYDGVATGQVEIEVRSGEGTWTSLGSATDVSFDVYCEQAAVVHESASVEVGTYDRVRITLVDFEMSVPAGAVVRGVTYADAFGVTFGTDGPVVIELTVPSFTLAEGENTRVLVDLNTEVWLDAESIAAGVISASEIEAAANVFVR